LTTQRNVNLHAREVQDLDIEFFSGLGKNDILFIDCSHVAKVDSDVNWLYLEVLPNLNKGVVIHIDDIPFPYLTAPPEDPLFEHTMLWNESAMVKALLTFSTAFEVLMCQSYLHYEFPELIHEVIGHYDRQKHFPAALWLAKTE
jgi:hypothetical protein